MKKIYTLLFAVCFIFLFNSCSDEKNPTNPTSWTETKTTYDVQYTDNTVVIEQNELSNLLDSDDDYVYTFQKDFSKAKNLKEGDILLIYGKSLRKVLSVEETSNNISVETEYATLDEAIKDGKMSWDVLCDFQPDATPIIQFQGKDYYPKTLSGDILEWNFEIGDYSYEISMKLLGDKADVKFSVEKEIGSSVKGKFIADGSFERFRSKSELEFNDSKLINFDQENNGLRGECKLSLVVTASGSDNFAGELPIVLFKYPVMVGPIPVFINIKAQIVIKAVVPLDGSAQVTAKFKYDSKTGFKYNGYDFSANANVGPYTIDKEITQTGASGAIGVNFGIGFPRLEVGIFDEVIVPWIQTAFLIGGDFTFTPPCQQAKASFIGGYGVDFSLLGLKASFTRNLWQKDEILLKSGECE